MQLKQHLIDLGLSEMEARTYLSALSLGTSTVKPIADRAGVKRTSIYNFMDRLIALGLMSRSIVKGRARFTASSPSRLLTIQRARLAQLDEAIPQFMQLVLRGSKQPKVHFYQGREEVKNIVLEEIRCRREALYIWTGHEMMEMVGGSTFMAEVDRQRIERGVKIRTIRFRERDVRNRYSAHGPKFLRDLRFAPKGFSPDMGLGVYDTGKVAFFSSRKEQFGVLIESRELEELMRLMYNFVWQKCDPARVGEG